MVDFSVKDIDKGKTYVSTKKGLEIKNMKGLKNTDTLDLLIKYLDYILKF